MVQPTVVKRSVYCCRKERFTAVRPTVLRYGEIPPYYWPCLYNSILHHYCWRFPRIRGYLLRISFGNCSKRPRNVWGFDWPGYSSSLLARFTFHASSSFMWFSRKNGIGDNILSLCFPLLYMCMFELRRGVFGCVFHLFPGQRITASDLIRIRQDLVRSYCMIIQFRTRSYENRIWSCTIYVRSP